MSNSLVCPGHIVDKVECGHQALRGPHTDKQRHFNCGVITHTIVGKWESREQQFEQQLELRTFLCCLDWFCLLLSLSLSLHCIPVGFPGFKGEDDLSVITQMLIKSCSIKCFCPVVYKDCCSEAALYPVWWQY